MRYRSSGEKSTQRKCSLSSSCRCFFTPLTSTWLRPAAGMSSANSQERSRVSTTARRLARPASHRTSSAFLAARQERTPVRSQMASKRLVFPRPFSPQRILTSGEKVNAAVS